MKCELCHKRDAETVLYRPSKDGHRQEELYVCRACAEHEHTFGEHGIQIAAMDATELGDFNFDTPFPPQGAMPPEGLPMPLSPEEAKQFEREIAEAGLPDPKELFGKLGEMFGELSEKMGEGESDEKRCPACGMTQERVRTEGILGCETCVDTFGRLIDHLLMEIQETTTYTGKPPARFAHLAELKRLESALAAAIQAEDYRKAKHLRASITRLKHRFGLDEEARHG